jgi:N-methylhydantoinase A
MYEASATNQAVLATLSADDIQRQFDPLYDEAADVLARADIQPADAEVHLSLDMRHVDQGHEIKVPLEGYAIDDVTPDAVREAFEQAYRETFNRDTLDFPVEVLTYRLELSEPDHDAEAAELAAPAGDAEDPGPRDVYFGTDVGRVETHAYRWENLNAGQTLEGPLVVEADQTTVVADPESTVEVADNYDITINLQ